MTLALRWMGNLVTDEDRDRAARVWRWAGRRSLARDHRPPFAAEPAPSGPPAATTTKSEQRPRLPARSSRSGRAAAPRPRADRPVVRPGARPGRGPGRAGRQPRRRSPTSCSSARAMLGRRLVRFMCRADIWDAPLPGKPIGRGMEAMRHIPVDRAAPAAAYLRARSLLGEGEAVCVFPEGGISTAYVVRALMPGAVALARETGAPLVPVSVWGSQRLWAQKQAPRRAAAQAGPDPRAAGRRPVRRADDGAARRGPGRDDPRPGPADCTTGWRSSRRCPSTGPGRGSMRRGTPRTSAVTPSTAPRPSASTACPGRRLRRPGGPEL